jgi:hypothetical protein
MTDSNPDNLEPETTKDAPEAEIIIDRRDFDRVMARLKEALMDGIKNNIKGGLLHLPDRDRHALLVASDVIQKSQEFPNYKLTFYNKGMGEGTNTCAVTFTHIDLKS